MKEIEKVKPRFTAVSTFSGCGGSSLGYRMAGFDVRYAVEFVDKAREVYKLNAKPTTVVDARDIRSIDPIKALKNAHLDPSDIDLLDGSPPCSAFSQSGRGAKGWGEVKDYSDKSQRVDDLFEVFIEWVRLIKPRIFVAENVYGLVKGAAKGYFKYVLRQMRESGYRVECRLVQAHRLGIPQTRERLIFIGVRDDLNRAPVFPKPYPAKMTPTVRQLFPYVKRLRLGGMPDKWRHPDQPSPTIFASDATKPESAYFSAGGWIETDNARRKWNIDELKIICAFPADFKLTGTYAEQWERLGRAVPPLMMAKVAQPLADLLDEIKE